MVQAGFEPAIQGYVLQGFEPWDVGHLLFYGAWTPT